MKRILLVFSFALLAIFCMVSDVSGIGISPARWTNDLLDIDCSFNSGMTYSLVRPSTRYSQFSIHNPAGLNGTITGSSASSGIEYVNNSTLMIDWESDALSSADSITASIHVQSPESWACPVEPGGYVLADLVRHTEMVDTGSGITAALSAVSEISLWRNYAPRAYLQSSATTGLAVDLGLQFEDKSTSWWAHSSEYPWFSYEIDWDGDGLLDLSGTATFDEEPLPHSKYPSLSTWTSGIQISEQSIEHVFSGPGDYLTTLYITDGKETTILQIPIYVTPEPATIALLGLGGLLLRKRYL